MKHKAVGFSEHKYTKKQLELLVKAWVDERSFFKTLVTASCFFSLKDSVDYEWLASVIDRIREFDNISGYTSGQETVDEIISEMTK